MCEVLLDGKKCCMKEKYGKFCYKHRRDYLIKNGEIIFDKFTHRNQDYLKSDLLNTIKTKNKLYYLKIKTKNQKKQYYYDKFLELFNSLNKYNELCNLKSIIMIQSLLRKKNIFNNVRSKGIGFLNKSRCNNNEDFFTYDNVEDIENIYFISYKDINNLIWGFDIRSYNKLIEHSNLNPYTREKFPESFIYNATKIIINLKKQKLKLNYDKEINKERKDNIKQLTVDLFTELSISGYDCDIKWLLDVNLIRLKQLYRTLEDIWNYRAQLTQESKNNIVPPNGIIFNTPVYEVDRMTNKKDIQSIIINDVLKFKNAVTTSDKDMGFMYFLIGLSFVSHDCYLTYGYMVDG
jgi:hypothetical protein